jgi:hypothetical protein
VISIANGEFIGYRRKNSQPSVLAVFTSSKFSKADVQSPWTNFCFRHTAAIDAAKKAAGSRHAWWLRLDWFGLRERE